MENLSPMHILLLAAICLVIFGGKRLPEMGAAMGKSIREFKRGMRDDLPDDSAGPAQTTDSSREAPRKLSE